MRFNLKIKITFWILLVSLIQLHAQAKTFRNSYVSFDLPDNWNCQIEGTEYVCRTLAPGNESKEAIIILTAKEAGPLDTLQQYEMYLKAPKSIPSRTGVPTQSQVLKVEIRQINNHPWVDGMHLGSEIPNYYTRYMATIKDQLGIVVTFSAHKLYYPKYANDFLKAITSLRVLSIQQSAQNSGGGSVGGTLGGAPGAPILLDAIDANEPQDPAHNSLKTTDLYLGLGLLLAAIGFYFLIKKGSKKKPGMKK